MIQERNYSLKISFLGHWYEVVLKLTQEQLKKWKEEGYDIVPIMERMEDDLITDPIQVIDALKEEYLLHRMEREAQEKQHKLI